MIFILIYFHDIYFLGWSRIVFIERIESWLLLSAKTTILHTLERRKLQSYHHQSITDFRWWLHHLNFITWFKCLSGYHQNVVIKDLYEKRLSILSTVNSNLSQLTQTHSVERKSNKPLPLPRRITQKSFCRITQKITSY